MIYVLSGGGSGCTLVVTGVAGDTCTITNSSTGKSNSKTFDANKQATFKGLATGTWTVKMTGSSGTATRTVTINADYTCTITYFSATINITYPEASVCTITNSSGETVASDSNSSTSSTKTWAATVGLAGTYTITSASSDGANTTTQDVVITTDGQSETVTLVYIYWIIKDGIMQSDYTITRGKWTNNTSTTRPAAVQTQGNGYVDAWSASPGGLVMYPSVDLTGFKTFTMDFMNKSNHATPVGFSKSEYVDVFDAIVQKPLSGYNTQETLTLDISEIGGAAYLKWEYISLQTGIRIYNMWLS